MVRYISLLKFTHQGAEKMEGSTERARIFQQEAADAGVNVESAYWCTGGTYDGVLILTAENEHEALRQLVRLRQNGNVSAENMRLYGPDEFDILTGLKHDE